VSRPDSLAKERIRARIAQATARLIAEHGVTDWSAAKRKACRELGLPDRTALPGNEEVEQALHDYNNLFRQQSQPMSLRVQRQAAMEWMDRLRRWRPILVGGAASGWATDHSDVHLELEAEDPKEVELALINAGVDYEASGPGGDASRVDLRLDLRAPGACGVRLTILTPAQRRNRPRRDDVRLSSSELRSLLGG
jgi:hypothetical protein